MHEPWNPDRRASAVAARQHAVLAHRQAVAAGLSDHQIDGRVRRGLWRRVRRGIYVVAGSPDTWQQRTWVAYLAAEQSDGVVSHFTAGALHGLTKPSLLPHVTVPTGRSTRGRVAIVHRGMVAVIDRATVDGLRLARRSVTVWTEAIAPDTVGEARLVRQLLELGLRNLVTQYDIYDDHGAFVARIDLAEPDRRRGFEYDGRATHGPRAWGRDEPRYARLRQLGWDVESVTKFDLLPGEPRLPAIVARWLAG